MSEHPPNDGLIREELDVLQSDIDDESPQVLGAFIDLVIGKGALDAHLSPLLMKKNRPGQRLEVLCRPEDTDRLSRVILVGTSTLGVKVRRVTRVSLPRRFEQIMVFGHKITIKIAILGDQVLRAVPEFEDCKALAQKLSMPLREILDEARSQARIFLAEQNEET